MKPKLSSSVSVVKINSKIIEFFKTNTRQQLRISIENEEILEIILDLDGEKSIDEIVSKYKVKKSDLDQLIKYLEKNGLLNNVYMNQELDDYEAYRRVINFLNDFSSSKEHLKKMWNKLRNSTVLLVGIGGVGSWVATNLIQSGVKKIILVDGDKVDLSNLHRQYGYTEADIGKLKIDVLEKKLRMYEVSKVEIIKCNEFLNEKTLEKFDKEKIDIIINCADSPSVDQTSLWVGEYAMKRNIPHIVGGGYNLHLSLIGQTVLPHETACIKCFQLQLEEENRIDRNTVKKLQVKNRKIGSFAPMCSIIASIIGMEAIKVLSGCIKPSNINRRGEFDIHTMSISYKNFLKKEECEWCGKNGKYKNNQC